MPTPAEISTQMVRALQASEPDLDTSVGTPVRKILDTVAESISEAYLDRYMLSYQYDIDARSGADLDAFVSLFGFARNTARRATGSVLLQRSSPASSSSVIPSGSQLATADTPPVIVQTTTPAIFPQSTLSITVPVQTIIGGASSNLPANSIVRWVTPIEGIAAVSNPASLTGGADAESDEQLRARFKRTLFRNLAGTEDMYLGVALSDIDVSAGIVLGPSERWRERIQIVGGTATLQSALLDRNITSLTVTAATNATPIVVTANRPHWLLPGDIVQIASVGGNTAANGTHRVKAVTSDTAFSLQKLDKSGDVAGNGAYTSGGTIKKVGRIDHIYADSVVVSTDLDNAPALPANFYTVSSAIPPVITVVDTVQMPDGLYDVTFDYAPRRSRNDVINGITNRVDVWLRGSRAASASEALVVDGAATFNTTPTDARYIKAWRRPNGKHPVSGSILLPLGFSPLVTVPTTINVGGVVLTAGTHYFAVRKEDGPYYGSHRAQGGVEILSSALQATEVAIASSTNATPIVVTTAAHNFQVGQRVYISGHATNTAANGYWTVSARSGTTITLQGSVGNGVGGATGTVKLYNPVTVDYTYNEVPRIAQQQIEAWRMATTDVLMHEGRALPLKIYAQVMLRPGYTTASVQSSVNIAVSDHLASLGLGGTVQISDILNVIGDVSGIDAVRLTNSYDVTTFAISAATNASPIVVTSAAHGLTVGSIQLVYIDGVGGNTAANGIWLAEVTSTTQVTLLESSGNGAYTSGGTLYPLNWGVKVMSTYDTAADRMFIGQATAPEDLRSRDIVADDHEYFTLHSVVLTARAPNTWGVQ